MTEPDADEIAKLVEQLDAGTLKALLIEFAGDHEAVRERLERLRLSAQPRKLTAAFRATLSGWRRSSRYLTTARVTRSPRNSRAGCTRSSANCCPGIPSWRSNCSRR